MICNSSCMVSFIFIIFYVASFILCRFNLINKSYLWKCNFLVSLIFFFLNLCMSSNLEKPVGKKRFVQPPYHFWQVLWTYSCIRIHYILLTHKNHISFEYFFLTCRLSIYLPSFLLSAEWQKFKYYIVFPHILHQFLLKIMKNS